MLPEEAEDMEESAGAGAHAQQDFLQYMNHMILQEAFSCSPVSVFSTTTGSTIASSDVESACFCCLASAVDKEQLWQDTNGRLVLGIKEEDRGTFSTRRSCIVRAPNTNIIGRVVIKTSHGQQNNSIQDLDYRTIATFKREGVFSQMTTFNLPDGQQIGRMQHQNGGRRVVIEFQENCFFELKILLMAAAVLYQRTDTRKGCA